MRPIFFKILVASYVVIVSLTQSCQSADIVVDEVDSGYESFKMKEFMCFDEWGLMQGGAVFGDKLVCLSATDWGGVPNGFVYDLVLGKLICKMTFSSTLDGHKYSMPHANQVSFGTIFYNKESDFSLLYVSQVNGGNGRNDISGERGVLVYNLKLLGNNQYIPELVQAIVPDLNDSLLIKHIGKYTPNYIVNTDENLLVVIGYPNNSWYDLSGPQPVAFMRIPSLSEIEYVFTNKEIIDSFELPRTVVPQQSFYFNGKIFSSGGDAGQASIRVIDLLSPKEEYYLDMSSITGGEPQFLGLWKDKLLYYEYGDLGIVYEIVLPGYKFHN